MFNNKIKSFDYKYEYSVSQLLKMSNFFETNLSSIPYNYFLMHNFERTLLWSLAKYIFPINAKYLEIGTYAGSSALVIKNANPTIDITCIDPYFENDELKKRLGFSMDELYYKTLNKLSEVDDYPEKMKLIRGPSEKILPTFKNDYFDIIFIDGNHSYEAVRLDILNSYPKIKNDGIIFGHDSSFPIVYECIDRYIGGQNFSKNITTLKFKEILLRVFDIDEFEGVQINDFWFARIVK